MSPSASVPGEATLTEASSLHATVTTGMGEVKTFDAVWKWRDGFKSGYWLRVDGEPWPASLAITAVTPAAADREGSAGVAAAVEALLNRWPHAVHCPVSPDGGSRCTCWKGDLRAILLTAHAAEGGQ